MSSNSSSIGSNDVPEPDGLPDYCCALLETPDGRWLLERRPPTAMHAPGLLTCFGGRREPGEDPVSALRRELREELGWEPDCLERRVALWVNGKLIAWFYQGELTVPLETLRLLPGTSAQLAASHELDTLPLSPWHRAVLLAARNQMPEVHLQS